ncbi:MAG: pyrroline-5-carboxylate reductase [Planctomycetes bacterium]|nr:pyrroline-5-carboxylate reductase [Planctomycetota bacterium]
MPNSTAPHEQDSHGAAARRLAVLGFGKLASALVRGCLATGFLSAGEIVVWARSDRRMAEAKSLGLKLAGVEECARSAHALLLSVKPQFFNELAPRIVPRPQATVISVMAGWSCGQLAQRLNVAHVIRAMPNVAAEVRAAVTALSIPESCPPASRDFAVKLFESVGRVELLHETHLDAATAISSSGLAYLCLFIEAMERAAVRLGLPADVSKSLSLDVLQGVAKSVASGRIDPAALRASVTSPNGTTAAALAVFESGEFTQLIHRAAQAARDRAAELGRSNA